jgi:hypothetical protein
MLLPIRCAGASRQNKGETVMIDVALVAIALGIPALIMATMLGSNLKLDW